MSVCLSVRCQVKILPFQRFPKVTKAYPMLTKVPRSSMILHAVPWACIKFHELACNSMSLQTVTCAWMQFHEHAYNSMSLHAVPKACMQFHELACSSIKFHTSLSSSQELCSACFDSRQKNLTPTVIQCLKVMKATEMVVETQSRTLETINLSTCGKLIIWKASFLGLTHPQSGSQLCERFRK